MKYQILIFSLLLTVFVYGQEKDFSLERNDSLLKIFNIHLSYKMHLALTSPKYQNPFSPSDNHYIMFIINDTSSVSLKIFKKINSYLEINSENDSLQNSEINYFYQKSIVPGGYILYWKGLGSNKNYVEKGFYIYEFEIRPLSSIFKYPEIYILDEWMH